MSEPLAYIVPGGRVQVRSEDASAARWLDEILVPGFDVGTPEAGDPTVVIRAHQEETPAPEDFAETVPCFALDRGIVENPAARYDDRLEIFDEKLGCRYSVENRSVVVRPVVPGPRTRVGALRVVRELVAVQALSDRRATQFHAAAFERGGDVVLLAGPKGAGKTTLLTHLASVAGVNVASNDRVLVTPEAGGWCIRNVATIVSVRPGTIEHLPHLFDAIPDVPSPAHLTRIELEEAISAHGVVSEVRRLKLSPGQLAAAAGTHLSGKGSLARVAFLSVEPGRDRHAIHPLDEGEAVAALQRAIYGRSAAGSPTVFAQMLGVDRAPDADADVARSIAARVPCVEIAVGAATLRDAEAARDLAARLLDG